MPATVARARATSRPRPRATGPGVIVIQEWWGLVGHIRDVTDRFAAEGFVALAPDFFHGAKTDEPDEAMRLLMGLAMDQAAKDIQGAARYLDARDEVTSDGVGVVGFCMGGSLALWSGALADEVKVAVGFYPADAVGEDVADVGQLHQQVSDDPRLRRGRHLAGRRHPDRGQGHRDCRRRRSRSTTIPARTMPSSTTSAPRCTTRSTPTGLAAHPRPARIPTLTGVRPALRGVVS